MKQFMLVAFLLAYVHPSFSQDTASVYRYWMTLGAWADRDVAVNLAYSFSPGWSFFSVGYFERGGLLGGLGNDGFHFHAVNASIGDRLQSAWFQLSGFVGPAFVFGEKQTSGGSRQAIHTIGVNLDSECLVRVADEVGIGIALYGNLNLERNYSGFNIRLTIGNGK